MKEVLSAIAIVACMIVLMCLGIFAVVRIPSSKTPVLSESTSSAGGH